MFAGMWFEFLMWLVQLGPMPKMLIAWVTER